MADLDSRSARALSWASNGDKLLLILEREAQNAIARVAEHLNLPSKSRSDSRSQLVCQSYEARRKRIGVFDAELFGEPAWDILLFMYREHLLHRTVGVAEVTASADVPISVAVRWLSVLQERGLVEQSKDELCLTSAALRKLEIYVDQLQNEPPGWVI